MATLQNLVFGFDLENIERLQKYVEKNYNDNKDYKLYVGIGDDVMNSMDCGKKVIEDVLFWEYVNSCEGEGMWIEE